MKVNSEESVEVLQSTGQHMSPPSLVRPKSGMGTIVVDMGNRGEVDLRLKTNAAMGVDVYSPNKKTARSEPVSRIHCIPLLMVLVFFILWAGSSEIPPEVGLSSEEATPEIFVMRMPTPNKFATSEQLKVFNEDISQHGTRTVLNHDHVSHSKHASHSVSKDGSSENKYMRGNTR